MARNEENQTMCMFSGRVQQVRSTNIFARLQPDPVHGASQYLVYSLKVSTDTDVAMILPLPISNHAEDAVQFIALDGYPEFFEDMEKGWKKQFGRKPSSDLLLGVVPRNLLSVQEVGDFIASFVPTLADFDRLDPRFRLPPTTWDQLPQYRDWGFAVFQLQATTVPAAKGKATAKHLQQIHPMAFLFPTRLSEALYFPTIHIHDGQVKEQARFDHFLYFQGERFQEVAVYRSDSNARNFVNSTKTKGIVQPDAPCYRRRLVLEKPNKDTILMRKA